MRAAVASQCGLRIPDVLALGLLNSRYAACVLAQLPHASLIGEAGDFASCSAVFTKRRFRRLSHRSARANSCVTHSTDSVPTSIIACTSGSSHRAVLRKLFAPTRRRLRRGQDYPMRRSVSSTFSRSIKWEAESSRDVCNRKVMLLNSDGYWLYSAKPEDEWGFMYDDKRERTFGKDAPGEWRK